MPRGSSGGADGSSKKRDSRYDFVPLKIHRYTRDKLKMIAKVMSDRATEGAKVPVRFDLGCAHLVDVLVERFAKEQGVE